MKLTTSRSFALAIALGAFAYVGGTGLTVSSAWLITMASFHPPILVLGVSIVMVRFFGIFRSVARYGERVISHEAIFKKLTGIRVQLFTAFASRIQESDQSIAQQSKAVVDDVERAQEFHLRVTLPRWSAVVSGVVTLLLALWIDSSLFYLACIVSSVFLLFIPIAVRNFLDPVAIEIERNESRFASDIANASHALVEAEIFGYADTYRENLAEAARTLKTIERRNLWRTSILQLIVITSIGSALVGMSAVMYSRNDLLPIQISMSIFLLLVGFEGYTTWFPNLFPAGKNRRASAEVMRLSSIAASHASDQCVPQGFAIAAVNCNPYWTDPFLAPLAFEVREGETLVINGPSGVGKSTLAASFFGFAEYMGSLTVGGIEVGNLKDSHLYITGSLQHGHIFNTTLRENLKIADNSLTDEVLQELLSALELDAITLDEVLGEFGRALSGGEAKRLSIARALLSPAPIVIMDEPLEHLDHERALRIQEVIMKKTSGKTLIVITHAPWLQYSQKLTLARE